MLDTGSPCPHCGHGAIVLVSKYRRAAGKVYSDQELAGPVHAVQTQYRCSEGCTWVEKEERKPAPRDRPKRWRSVHLGRPTEDT